jgi:hypothetical protein
VLPAASLDAHATSITARPIKWPAPSVRRFSVYGSRTVFPYLFGRQPPSSVVYYRKTYYRDPRSFIVTLIKINILASVAFFIFFFQTLNILATPRNTLRNPPWGHDPPVGKHCSRSYTCACLQLGKRTHNSSGLYGGIPWWALRYYIY